MRRFAAALAIVALAGFGCTAAQDEHPAVGPNWTVYENTQYGFSFAYPSNMDVRQREENVRAGEYLGIDVDFFVSLRDTALDTKPTNVAWFYAAPGLTEEAFLAALVASNQDGAVQVKSVEDANVGGLALKKVTSTTEMGKDKTHYLLDRDGTMLIISVFLAQEAAWDEIARTMRPLE